MTRLRNSLLILVLAVLSGCSTSPYRDGYPTQESWAVLPVQSLESEEAGVQIERMLKVLLASKGVQRVELPPETETRGANTLLTGAHRLQNAIKWAEQHDIRLGMIGTVDELRTDQTERFHLGLTLNLIDIETGDSLWTTSGQAEGKPGEDPYDISRKLIGALLSGLPMTENLASTGWFYWLH